MIVDIYSGHLIEYSNTENCSLMELLLRSGQGNEIRRMVAKRLTTNDRMKSSWRNIIPLFINVTIGTLYPFN